MNNGGGATIVDQNGRLRVSGELNFSTIPVLLKNSLPLLANGPPQIEIDLSQVTASNSAGLALLLEWSEYAKSNHQHILFTKIPEQLMAIARMINIDILTNPH
jgi:phospholipid transport system transporter-binding protein